MTRLRRVTREDVQDYPLIGIPMVSDMLLKMGATTNKFMVDHLSGDIVPHIATTSLHAMRELLLHTDGIGLYLPSQVREDVRAGRLAVLDVDFDLPSTAYGIVRLRGRSLSPAARAFIETVKAIEAEHDQLDSRVASAGPIRMRRKKPG